MSHSFVDHPLKPCLCWQTSALYLPKSAKKKARVNKLHQVHFAKNYKFVIKDKVQSSNYNQQFALHPIIIYFNATSEQQREFVLYQMISIMPPVFLMKFSA